MRLSASQIAQFAAQAGFQGQDVITATAVALAESNVPPTSPPTGNSDAYNPEIQAGTATGQGSIGLWQIYKSAHPELASLDLADPWINAQAAFSVFTGAASSFLPWSTFKSGAYVKFVQQAATAVGQLTGQGANQASDGGGAPPADSVFRQCLDRAAANHLSRWIDADPRAS